MFNKQNSVVNYLLPIRLYIKALQYPEWDNTKERRREREREEQKNVTTNSQLVAENKKWRIEKLMK